MLADDPPNRRPSPEVIAARLGEVATRYERKPRPFDGLDKARRDETRWLLRGRGVSSEEIKAQIDRISASIGFGNSKRLSQRLKLLGTEKDSLTFTSFPRSTERGRSKSNSIAFAGTKANVRGGRKPRPRRNHT
jgi:hypothetical protein